MTLALSTLDAWLVGAVAVLTLLAIGHLAARWAVHTSKSKPAQSSQPGTKKKPRTPAAPSPPPSPAQGPEGDTLAARREWVRERVVHWWVVANRAHDAKIDDVPTVQFSPRLRHALGWADSSRNLIKISDHHLMEKPRAVADETVAHEVAHIFADRHYGKPCRHNKLWKKTMVAMGQRPEVTFKDTRQEDPQGGEGWDEGDTPASQGKPASAA